MKTKTMMPVELTNVDNDSKALLAKDTNNFYYTGLEDPTGDKDVLFGEDSHDTETLKKPSDKTYFSRILVFFGYDKHAKATVFSTAINISNSNIGAGILGLPFAAAITGWFTALILSIIFCIASIIGMNFQMQIGRNLGDTASYAIACRAIWPKFQIIADFSVALQCFGAICAYFIIIGDNMSAVMAHEDFNLDSSNLFRKRQTWIAIFTIFLIIPTTSLRKLDALRFTSAIAILCFFYVFIIFILYTFIDELQFGDDNFDETGGFNAFEGTVLDVFKAVPIWLFAYGGQSLSFTASTELDNNTPRRINYTILLAYFFVGIIYTGIALLGYRAFGDNVESNALNDFPATDVAILIVRVGLSIAVAFSVPVLANPLKHSLASMIWKKIRQSVNEDASTLSTVKFYGLTYGIIMAAFTIAMFVENLGVVLSINGATSGVLLRLIIPAVFYYYSDNMDCKEIWINPYHRSKRVVAAVFIVIGIILIPLCLVVTFAL